jgi:hypothetical protein
MLKKSDDNGRAPRVVPKGKEDEVADGSLPELSAMTSERSSVETLTGADEKPPPYHEIK